MSSAETTTTAHDYLYVRIKSASGTTLTTLATISNGQKTSYASWQQVTLTIPAAYAVAGNVLWFDASENGSLQTTFFLDSVSIQ
jgi:hypothetical protein